MITPDLIEYIKIQLNKNIPKDLVISNLLGVGWRMEDIEEGFLKIEPVQIVQEIPQIEKEEVKNNIDKYREPLDGTEIPTDKLEVKSTPQNSLELLKVWVPTNIKPVIIGDDIVEEEPEVKLEPVEEVKVEEAKKIEPEIKIEPEKEVVSEKKVEVFNLELEGEKKDPIVFTNPIIEMVISPKKEEPLAPKQDTPVVPVITKLNIPADPVTIKPVIPVKPIDTKPTIPVGSASIKQDIVPKTAMLTSYSKDLLSVSEKKEKVETPSNHKRWILKIGILIVTLTFVGGMVFAFMEGYIKVPWSKLSFLIVKKDPKVVILNAPSTISNLKSYKIDTNITISSPSLSSITTGLSSGEAVTSNEEDSISINTKGRVNRIGDKTIFDYIYNLKSSLLENEITSNWKSDGNNLSISIPDLTQIFKEETPVPTTVFLNRNQLGLIVPELSTKIQDLIKKVDIYNILSSEVPLYVKYETVYIIKEFISTLEYVDKGKENIHGIETRHYEVIATRPATKKFLISMIGLFSLQFTDEEKNNLDEALGAASINSFDVWTGKDDDNLYQIKFTLNIPLSRVLWLNDSGIAGGEVKLDWMTTYYDLNIENNIVVPRDEGINIEQFINNIKDIKIKNVISSFKSETIIFKNAVGSYGKKTNTSGSCTLPDSGSIFSPLGHVKGADMAVSSISSSISSLLLLTKGEGFCYSTPKAWALSAPLSTTPVSYFCTDSEGTTTTLLEPITKTICSNPVPPVSESTTKTPPITPSTPKTLPDTTIPITTNLD